LSKKDALLYAPLSNVGAVSFDKDAVYIDIGRANFTKKENLAITDGNDGDDNEESDSDSEDEDAPASLLKNLQDVKSGVDEKMKNSSLRIFKTSKAVRADDDSDSTDSESGSDDSDMEQKKKHSQAEIDKLVQPFRRDASLKLNNSDSEDDESDSDQGSDSDENSEDFSDSDDESVDSDGASDDASGDESESNDEKHNIQTPGSASASWKRNLAQRAAEAYMGRDTAYINLQELVYGKTQTNIVSDEEEDDEDSPKDDNDSDSDEEFFTIKKSAKQTLDGRRSASNSTASALDLGEEDSSRIVLGGSSSFDIAVWLEEGDDCMIESIRDKFVTGNWGNGDSGDVNDDDEAFGDFEDLETGEKFGPNGEVMSDEEEENDNSDGEEMTDAQMREINSQKKASKKVNFDEEYDDEKKAAVASTNPGDDAAENEYLDSLKREKEARLKRNKEEFGEDGESSRLRLEGFRPGLYCRIRIDGVPAEFTECFDPNLPVILGGLTPQETNRGYIRCRFKKHRWHKKILKCNDPLIFSVGWRRFQSIPVFSTEDQNRRHR